MTEAVVTDIQTSNMEEKTFQYINDTGEISALVCDHSAYFEKGRKYKGEYTALNCGIRFKGIDGIYDSKFFRVVNNHKLSIYRIKLNLGTDVVVPVKLNGVDSDKIIGVFDIVWGYEENNDIVVTMVGDLAVNDYCLSSSLFEKVADTEINHNPMTEETADKLNEYMRKVRYSIKDNKDMFGIAKQIQKDLNDTGKGDSLEVGGTHYKMAIEPWDYIYANGLDFDSGNVVKYISRFKEKNGAEDVKKAISYCKHILKTQYDEEI